MSVHLEKGRWYVRFQVDKVRIRKAIKEARTRKQAERAEQVLRNQLFEQKWGDTGKQNFADFVEQTYKPYAQQHKKGFNVERSVLHALIDSFGEHSLGDITPQSVLQFQQQRASETTSRGTQRSRATVNRDMAVLSAIFKLALRLGEVRENPVSKIKYFGNLRRRDRVLSKEEEIMLLNGIRNDKELSRQVEILLYTGLRRKELFMLQWRDIDFDRGCIRLRAETTKTDRARTMPLFSNVSKILGEVYREQKAPSQYSLIFNGVESRSIRFSARLKEACSRIGLSNITSHTLRHTFSTWANEFGVDPFAQKEALGHSRLMQTADYTHQSSRTFLRNFEGFETHLRQRNDKKLALQ